MSNVSQQQIISFRNWSQLNENEKQKIVDKIRDYKENNPIYFVNDTNTPNFYSLFDEIDNNIRFVLSFIKK